MKDFFQKNVGLIIGVLGGLASLIVILQFLVSPIYNRLDHIENQVNNHIPTQIRELGEKIDRTNQRLDQTNQRLEQKIDQTNQRLGQKIDQTNQRLDQTNQRLDRLFEMLAKNQQEK